jgi:hypothetical protein
MSVDWTSDEIRAWKQRAKQYQQNYLDVLCGRKWTKYNESDYFNLMRNIGFAIFEEPKETPDETNDFTGYKKRELRCINSILDAIKRHTTRQHIYVSFLYVCIKTEDLEATSPVISVSNHGSADINDIIFIDSYARVYKNWQDYLESNKLAECALCYPRNGMYSAVSGYVDVAFGISPAGQVGAKVLQGLDTTGAALEVGASCIVAAARIMPVASSLVLGQ